MRSERSRWCRRVPPVVVALLFSSLAFDRAARAAEPFRLGDLRWEPDGVESSYPGGWTESGSHSFFVAADGTERRSVWVTRGTAATTELLVDASPGGFEPVLYGVAQGRLFWWADAGHNSYPGASSGAVWSSDGTPETTRLATPLGLRVPTPDRETRRQKGLLSDGALYFAGCFPTECALWMSDGTPAGTVPFHPLPPGVSEAVHLALAGETLFFADGFDLWAYDLRSGRATLLVQGEYATSFEEELWTIGSRLFFLHREDWGLQV